MADTPTVAAPAALAASASTSIFDESAFIAGPVTIEVPYKDGTKKLIVQDLGYTKSQHCIAQAMAELKAGNQDANWLDNMVVASVSDENGNRFTLDEVRRLREEVATPIYRQVMMFRGVTTKKGDAGGPKL